MYFNRFDIAAAWYLALADCHGGPWSTEYERLCRLRRIFHPGYGFNHKSLSENAKEIYEAACKRMLPMEK